VGVAFPTDLPMTEPDAGGVPPGGPPADAPTPDRSPVGVASDGLDDDGAPLSFDRYVRDRSPALLRTAFLLTGDRHRAEDLVQTTLTKVLDRWDGIAARGDPHAYLRTVLLRTALGWRRRKWEGERPSSELPDRAEATDATATIDRRDRLRVALLGLPPRQRAAVVLRHYEDLSEADTAAVLGCSVGTVKSQTAKGLERLRALLTDD